MSGFTKHIFEKELNSIILMWNNQIKTIQPILPKDYSVNDVIELLKKFYPYEWRSVEIKYNYYKNKDRFIIKRYGKPRYNMQKPETLLLNVPKCKQILLDKYKESYSKNYNNEICNQEMMKLWEIQKPKIERVKEKIETALAKTQQVTPLFINTLMGYYVRKNTSQKDKRYILLELEKYYSDKIIQFFLKLNDTELNRQLRMEAFYHLQKFNYQPRLRKQKYMRVHTKNKKRKKFLKEIYPFETYEIPKNPNELEYRIENSKEQKIKEYDYFISHSSKDSLAVQKLIKYENQKGKNIFCDWINDVDYLKRHLFCEATLKVIEKRLEQSKSLIFVKSSNSCNSIWCKYELNYFKELGKPVYCISKESINNEDFSLYEIKNNWFLDSNYKRLAIIESNNIK